VGIAELPEIGAEHQSYPVRGHASITRRTAQLALVMILFDNPACRRLSLGHPDVNAHRLTMSRSIRLEQVIIVMLQSFNTVLTF